MVTETIVNAELTTRPTYSTALAVTITCTHYYISRRTSSYKNKDDGAIQL